jgi:hypothetical protein
MYEKSSLTKLHAVTFTGVTLRFCGLMLQNRNSGMKASLRVAMASVIRAPRLEGPWEQITYLLFVALKASGREVFNWLLSLRQKFMPKKLTLKSPI